MDNEPKSFKHEVEGVKWFLAINPQVTVSQMLFLFTVAEKDGITHTEMATELGVTMSAVTRNVDVFGSQRNAIDPRKKNLGLLEIRETPDDARIKRIHLTEQGWYFVGVFQALTRGEPLPQSATDALAQEAGIALHLLARSYLDQGFEMTQVLEVLHQAVDMVPDLEEQESF